MFAPLPRSPRAAQSCRAGRVFVQPSLEAQLRPLAYRDPLRMCAACGRAALRCVCALCVQVVGLAPAPHGNACLVWQVRHCVGPQGPCNVGALCKGRVGDTERRARKALDAKGAMSFLTPHVDVSGPVARATDKQIRLRWSAAHRECCSVRTCLHRGVLYIGQLVMYKLFLDFCAANLRVSLQTSRIT